MSCFPCRGLMEYTLGPGRGGRGRAGPVASKGSPARGAAPLQPSPGRVALYLRDRECDLSPLTRTSVRPPRISRPCRRGDTRSSLGGGGYRQVKPVSAERRRPRSSSRSSAFRIAIPRPSVVVGMLWVCRLSLPYLVSSA